MIVKRQKPIHFINACDCHVRYDELERAILWYQARPTARLKKIYLHGRYPTVSIHDKKVAVHRLLMMYWLGDRNLPQCIHVHHENENTLDCTKSNLTCYAASGHMSFHNKGKTLTAEHKIKISIAGKRRPRIFGRFRVDIPLADLKHKHAHGWSINRLAEYYTCDWTTIRRRLRHTTPELMEAE